MKLKLLKVSFLLAGSTLIFVAGVLIGSTLYKTDNRAYPVHEFIPSVSKVFHQTLSNKEQTLESFAFAHNKTHLWSMRLANDDYYRIARLLPCRTVEYLGGPTRDKMDSCDQSTLKEYSIESTLHAQQWLYNHQHPADCSNKKFAIIRRYAWSGFGSTIHQILWAFGTALGEDRIAIYDEPGHWLYGNCKLGTPDCVFLPITNCSLPSKIDPTQTIVIAADRDHWINPKHPPIFQKRSFNWYRSQLLFYLMRYNSETLAHVQNAVAKYFNPPTVDLHHPYIAVFVRRSDKVRNREMSQAYTLQQYFDLFDSDANRTKIQNVYLNSEDNNVFDEFRQINKNKQDYYKLLSINTTKDVVFMELAAMPLEKRGKIVLEFLTDLFIEVNAELHVGTLTSNWCRLVDEIRLTLGKIIPYYTPENRFIIDMKKRR